MSIKTKIDNIVSNNETNKDTLKNKPELLKSYERYITVITKLNLSDLKNTINSTPAIQNWMEIFIDTELKDTDVYIDKIINSWNLKQLDKLLIRTTNFIENKINSFTIQASRVKTHNEKIKQQETESIEQKKYDANKLELQRLLDNDFQNKLVKLDWLFDESSEKNMNYYEKQYDVSEIFWGNFWSIKQQLNNLANTGISISGMQSIFLNQWFILQQVNNEILNIIDNDNFSIQDKNTKIEKAIKEIKEFETKIDAFMAQIEKVESLDETEVDNKLIKNTVKTAWNILSWAAKMLIAPIGFWSWIAENSLTWNNKHPWIDTAEFAASFIPVVWNFVDFGEALYWTSWSWRKLSWTERWIAAWTWTLWMVMDLSWVWYFLRAGWKVAVKWTTKALAKWALRWGDDIIKVVARSEWFFVWGLKQMKNSWIANAKALWQWIAEKKLWILKDVWTYAVDDMKNIVWLNIAKWAKKGVVAWLVRTVNWIWKKDSFSWAWLPKAEWWKSLENFWHWSNLSRLEKTQLAKDAWITVNKDWDINDTDIKWKLERFFEWQKLERNDIITIINNTRWTNNETRIKSFMKQFWMTDKSIMWEVHGSNYDINLFADLIIAKQNREFTSANFKRFINNTSDDLANPSTILFDNNYISTQRRLWNIEDVNFKDTLPLFWKKPDWTPIDKSSILKEKIKWSTVPDRYTTWTRPIYKHEPIIDLKKFWLHVSKRWNNIYKYIKKNNISNIDDLANQIKKDWKLWLNYKDPNDFLITRQAAEQAWENAFTKRKKIIEEALEWYEQQIRRLETKASKLNDDYILKPWELDKIIKSWGHLDALKRDPETMWLFNNLDDYLDIKQLKTDISNQKTTNLNDISTKNESLTYLKNQNTTLLWKDTVDTVLVSKNNEYIDSLVDDIKELKVKNEKIDSALSELTKTTIKFESKHSNAQLIESKKRLQESLKKETDRIIQLETEISGKTPIFKELWDFDFEKVDSEIIVNYIKNPGAFIDSSTDFNKLVENISNNHWLSITPNQDSINHTALYIWKLNNPSVEDSLKLFIGKMELKNHNKIFEKLTNETGRSAFSDVLDKMELDLKSYKDKTWKEYLTKLQEYNNMHFLGKNAYTLKELFNLKKAIDWWADYKVLIKNNPELQKIMNIPELAVYVNNPSKLNQLFWTIWKQAVNKVIPKKVKKVADKVIPKISKAAKWAKKAIHKATEDSWK